jgi:shikimate kinase
MGAGKTTIGSMLANTIKWNFIDLDNLIEQNLHKTIKEIFATNGESFFRIAESQALASVSSLSNYVIATGGGVILKQSNITLMKKTGIQIWLKWNPHTLYLNAKNQSNNRPLFTDKNSFIKLYNSRKNLYSQADIKIICDNLTSEEVINKILKYLNKYNII